MTIVTRKIQVGWPGIGYAITFGKEAGEDNIKKLLPNQPSAFILIVLLIVTLTFLLEKTIKKIAESMPIKYHSFLFMYKISILIKVRFHLHYTNITNDLEGWFYRIKQL